MNRSTTHRDDPPGPDAPRANPGVALLRAHPVGAFLTWFFTVGQAFAFTPVIARGAGVDLPAQPFIVGSTLVGLLLPALVITRVVDGPEGLRALWSRAVRVRVPARWYALALVGVPLTTIGVTVALFGAPTLTPSSLASAVGYGLVLQLLLTLVLNNWWEEVAWMGFVQARLQERHGPARAAVVVGPLFALQHVSLATGNGLVVGTVFMVAFALLAIPFRALQAWVANSTGSLFLVGLVHAAGNAAASGSGFPGGDGLLARVYEQPLVGSMQTLASAALGLLVIAATRARLGRSRRVGDVAASPVDAAAETTVGGAR
jgi:membrane protease YdiL (CAAX protease family)